MGTVYTEITFRNSGDITLAGNGYIKPEQIRTATVTAVADTGALYPVITEELRQQLGLGKKGDVNVHVATGSDIKCYFTDNIEIHWKDRSADLPAIVIPGAKKVLFGALALEALDLMVDPVNQKVAGVHGDTITVLAL